MANVQGFPHIIVHPGINSYKNLHGTIQVSTFAPYTK